MMLPENGATCPRYSRISGLLGQRRPDATVYACLAAPRRGFFRWTTVVGGLVLAVSRDPRTAREAFAAGQDPKAFVEEAFAVGDSEPESELEEPGPGNKRKGGRYVEVSREAITSRLERAGFKRDDVRGEITYSRKHDRDSRLLVTVYTSVADGAEVGRKRGEDAIRVLAFFTWTRQGETQLRRKKLFQARVFRVTSVDGVLDRMMERARDAYAACNNWIGNNRS